MATFAKDSYIRGMESLERVFVALGSNIAPRGGHLAAGRAMLKKIASGGWLESRIYETPPVGPQDQGRYLNQVVSFWSSKGEESLLHYLKGAEILLGRRKRGHWCEREIDLDLLYYGKRIRPSVPVLPHPELSKRQFVLEPMCDIAPEWSDPTSGLTVRQMLFTLKGEEDITFRVASPEEP